MNPFERLTSQSPLPIADLSDPSTLPRDGFFLPLTEECRKNFEKGPECQRHYESLSRRNPGEGKLVQCPFGFASASLHTGGIKAALTGFIPYPRLGGKREQVAAKRHTHARVTAESVGRMISGLVRADNRFRALEDEAVKKASLALHEIRKFNATIKRTAERICKQQSKNNPDNARPEWVKVWKTSELMSDEFDVIEVLADESQSTLPFNMTAEVYKLFDKLVRIYNDNVEGGRRLVLDVAEGFYPRIAACDKTLPVIPSVFIENAFKYSAHGSQVRIRIDPHEGGAYCVVSVTNESEGQQLLDERVFLKGYRANTHRDGSGNGLYVAQLIAKQHGAKITVQSVPVSPARVRHTFRVVFKVIGGARK